jgi:ABC-type sugar transport system permease subunit
MKIFFLVLVLIVAICVANVICCAIFCEADNNANIAMPLVFVMPIFIVEMLFYFLFADKDEKYSGLQEAIEYIQLPAKNYLMVQVCTEA